MRLEGRRESDNVEDRREQSGGGPDTGFGGPRIPIGLPGGGAARGGGIGLVGILFILGVSWLLGINPLTLLDSGQTGSQVVTGDNGPAANSSEGKVGQPSDEGGKFVAQVLADTEDTWTRIFQQAGRTYRVPTLVLFKGSTSSACGFAKAAAGPFYCPNDQKLYIDLAFYDELRSKFGAPGDFAQAYVIAHEVGHHVQNLLGIIPKVDQMRRSASPEKDSALSVRLELQADCLAGVWGRAADKEGLLDPGDVNQAINAAAQIGDDTLQKRAQGYVVPETFTHGTSEQRVRWFKRGFDQGKIDACDTFGASEI
jgi:predicted metalloprotease